MKTLKLYLEKEAISAVISSGTVEVLLQLAENVAREAVAAVIAEKQRVGTPGRMAEMEDAIREEEWAFYERFFVDMRAEDDNDEHEDGAGYRHSMKRLIADAEDERLSMLQTHNRLRDRIASRERKRKSACLLAEEEGQKKARAE